MEVPQEDLLGVLHANEVKTGLTGEEMAHLAGEQAFREIRCVDSDLTDCVHMGFTLPRAVK